MSDKSDVLLILGGSSDIGIAYIKASHGRYHRVIAHYNTLSCELSDLKANLGDKLTLIKADFTDTNSSISFVNAILNLDVVPTYILHLPAEKGGIKRFSKMSWDDFNHRLNIGLRSIVMVLNKLLPAMEKRGGGKVLIMLTIHTCQKPLKGCADYVTEKYALLGLMEALAVEYSDKGVFVNGISPGAINTRFNRDLPEVVLQKYAEAAGRNLLVSDVVPSIDYLLSDDSGAINGNNFVLDDKGLKKYERP